MQAIYFSSPAQFRAWLEQHHQTERELLVGFWKRDSGQASMTWPESVDEALCFGWIDGVRRRVDDQRYTIRFTPRKPRSNWSEINIARVAELTKLGRMTPAGRKVFDERVPSKQYAYEARPTTLSPEYERTFRKQKKAWTYFQSEAPWYRRNVTYWVMSAKKEETRERRLGELIATSAEGRRIDRLIPDKPKG
ncbi:MAG: hypothetical protein QOH21_2859 [Acidobacteriota bacterium]|jgi:uncharacterized protein YdeI (YjbR/CyaY-like superfamily)|nr:hypothetical protein [Acidobacteriota bacterium]